MYFSMYSLSSFGFICHVGSGFVYIVGLFRNVNKHLKPYVNKTLLEGKWKNCLCTLGCEATGDIDTLKVPYPIAQVLKLLRDFYKVLYCAIVI